MSITTGIIVEHLINLPWTTLKQLPATDGEVAHIYGFGNRIFIINGEKFRLVWDQYVADNDMIGWWLVWEHV